MTTIRDYQDTDLNEVANIYQQSIRQLGLKYYSADQIAAWSGFADDREDFKRWVSESAVIVALDLANQVIGFAGLEEKGRISSLFVAPDKSGVGVGTSLLRHLLKEIRCRGLINVTTDASEFSKPLFEKFGFRVSNLEQTRFKGVIFHRYQMKLDS